MTLSLVTERNIQLFMQLAQMPSCRVSTDMYWQTATYETYLNYRRGRMHISQCLPLDSYDSNLLLLALHRWQPARFAGIPQRFFQLRRGLVMSCSPAADSAAELWLLLHRRQQAFLESLCKPQ
ncbi:type III secretion system protein SsaM [Yersinia aldovae]|uniref:type III secretion system protein SsaM n=1 Tax=Yersinia aldovae TaxID=29483 RepID=UPI0005AD0F52|nr:type III secretion system protein SsaM [Yersinia aldovae]AJJ62661.1 putative secretion system apparatus protein ssaM [Yersinia aldovae 670-83]